jgi:hypothetical protein
MISDLRSEYPRCVQMFWIEQHSCLRRESKAPTKIHLHSMQVNETQVIGRRTWRRNRWGFMGDDTKILAESRLMVYFRSLQKIVVHLPCASTDLSRFLPSTLRTADRRGSRLLGLQVGTQVPTCLIGKHNYLYHLHAVSASSPRAFCCAFGRMAPGNMTSTCSLWIDALGELRIMDQWQLQII